MNRRDELPGALAITAAALGLDFSTGRVAAVFYAQTGRAAWLGAAVAALLFGLCTAGLARMAGRNCLRRLGDLPGRIPGGPGMGSVALYGCILAASICLLAARAGEMGALVLPVRGGEFIGALAAMILAGCILLGGPGMLAAAGGSFLLLLAAFLLALLNWGSADGSFHYTLELHLRGSRFAAVGFAALHAAVCLCLSAGMTFCFAGRGVRAGRLGLWTGLLLFTFLCLANGVLASGEAERIALRLPFTALSSGWGTGGFYLSAGLNFLGSAVSLAGVGYVLTGSNAIGKRC